MFRESEVENKPSVHRNYSQLLHYDSSTFEHRAYNKFVHKEHEKSVHEKHEEFVHREHDKSVHRNYKEFDHRKQSQLVDTSADYGKPIKNKCQVKGKIYYIFRDDSKSLFSYIHDFPEVVNHCNIERLN